MEKKVIKQIGLAIRNVVMALMAIFSIIFFAGGEIDLATYFLLVFIAFEIELIAHPEKEEKDRPGN